MHYDTYSMTNIQIKYQYRIIIFVKQSLFEFIKLERILDLIIDIILNVVGIQI